MAEKFKIYRMRSALTVTPTLFFILFFHISSAQVSVRGSDTLKRSDKLLAEAVVVGRKPIIQMEIDRLRFNVAGTDLVFGNNIWGVIEKTPLVKAAEDGTLQIAGTTGAIVYINNKRKVLSGYALKAYLSAIPSDNLEAIEVITTPSSKYDAEGGAGILNIVTKKNKEEGFDGNVALSNRQTALNSQSGSVFLNDRMEKWNIYSDLYLVNRRRKRESNQDLYFSVPGSDGLTGSSIQSVNETRMLSSGANLGIDHQLSPNHVAGLLFDYSGDRNNNTRNAFSHDQYLTSNGLSYSDNTDKINSHTYSLNLNYDGKLDSTGKKLSVDLDALRYTSAYHSVSRTDVLDDITEKPLYVEDYFRSSSPQQVSNQSVKADFKWPFSKKISLEMGAKMSFSRIDDNLVFENNDGANGWVKDSSRSNLFKYDEDIAAVYVIVNHKINSRWAYQVGTRLENTAAKGYLDGEKVVNRNYINAFPTGFLKYSPAAQQAYVLAVSSRITRPSFWDVNPFRTYTTDKIYWEGNPFLLPSRNYREELRRTLNIGKASYTFQAAASQTLNEFYSLPYNDTGNAVVYKKVNYGNKYSYTGTLIYYNEIRPWWQFSGTILSGYVYSKGKYAAIPIDNKTFLLSISTNQTFNISRKNGLYCTVIANNSFPSTIVNTRVGNRLETEVRVRKTTGPFNITLAATDLFKSFKDNYVRHVNELKTVEKYYYDTRSVALTVNYNFGKSTVKKNRERDLEFQNVKDRII